MNKDIVERVADAIGNVNLLNYGLTQQEAYLIAKAAIEAMRDLVKCDLDDNKYDNDVFNQYIDRALKNV